MGPGRKAADSHTAAPPTLSRRAEADVPTERKPGAKGRRPLAHRAAEREERRDAKL